MTGRSLTGSSIRLISASVASNPMSKSLSMCLKSNRLCCLSSGGSMMKSHRLKFLLTC